VVYGSRFLGSGSHRVLYFWHSVGNRLLTLLSNCLTDINLSDMETCYKVFHREIIQSFPIEENRFGFEPEITVKVAKRRLRIYEVGISYWGRTYEEEAGRTGFAVSGACLNTQSKNPPLYLLRLVMNNQYKRLKMNKLLVEKISGLANVGLSPPPHTCAALPEDGRTVTMLDDNCFGPAGCGGGDSCCSHWARKFR
jgi:hypothetical protein